MSDNHPGDFGFAHFKYIDGKERNHDTTECVITNYFYCDGYEKKLLIDSQALCSRHTVHKVASRNHFVYVISTLKKSTATNVNETFSLILLQIITREMSLTIIMQSLLSFLTCSTKPRNNRKGYHRSITYANHTLIKNLMFLNCETKLIPK